MRFKGFLSFVLAGLCSAHPAAAASRFVVLSARHSFTIPRVPHGTALYARAHSTPGVLRAHSRFAGGYGDGGGILVGGGLGPDDSTGAIPPPPYPPAVFYPAYYAPRHCVHPKIIYLTDEKPTAAPVRIIYGTAPPDCPE